MVQSTELEIGHNAVFEFYESTKYIPCNSVSVTVVIIIDRGNLFLFCCIHILSMYKCTCFIV